MFIRSALTILLITMSVSIAAAEQHDCSFAKHPERVVARQTIAVGPPGHELIYVTRLDKIDRAALTDFVGGQAWIFNNVDDTKGTGSHSGWFEWIGKSGDKWYGAYKGTHVADGAVRTWQGTFDIKGGTGRYAKASGGGDYKGRAAADSYEETGNCKADF